MDAWRQLSPSQWQVTPETARLLQHWRHHEFSGVQPFFCQVEAAETAIWLTEVAPQSARGKRLLDHLAAANKDANPELMRLALKLATSYGAVPPVLVCAYFPVRCLPWFHLGSRARRFPTLEQCS